MSQRKKLHVDSRFKSEFLVRNIGLLILSLVLLFGLVKIWERNRLKQGVLLNPPTSQEVMEWAEKNNVDVDSKEFLRQYIVQAKTYTLFDLVWQPLVIILLINAIIMYITNLYFAHRVMGPISRLRTTMQKKLEGQEIQPLRFRKKDYFHDVAELLNRILFPEKKP